MGEFFYREEALDLMSPSLSGFGVSHVIVAPH
jgi:hypothetical protein